MKNLKKKGFTIVELVIVIAVIAILSAVLIPTFSNLIRKANVSADTQLVKQLNQALAVEEVENGKNATMHDALETVKEYGFDVTKINAKANLNEILWDSKNNIFVYYNDETKKIEYIPNSEPVEKGEGADLWKIYNDEDVLAEQKYSIYWNQSTEFSGEISVGFDAGNTVSRDISYKTDKEQEVVIRTNGGKLTLEAAKSIVNHYGVADEVVVTDVASATYNLFGKVDFIQVAAGEHVVLTEQAEVNGVFVAGADKSNVEIKNGQDEKVQSEAETNLEAVKASATKFAGGLGTENDPYIIKTVEHMQNISKKYDSYNYYKVADGVDEIDLSSLESISLNGSFNGNGVSFSNLYVPMFRKVEENSNAYIGGFAVDCNVVTQTGSGAICKNGSKNMTFNDITITGYIEGQGQTAAVISYPGSGITTFKNINVKADIVSLGDNGAAVFVINPYKLLTNYGGDENSKLIFDDCHFDGKLSATKNCLYFYAHSITVPVEIKNIEEVEFGKPVNTYNRFALESQSAKIEIYKDFDISNISSGSNFVIDKLNSSAVSCTVTISISPNDKNESGSFTGVYLSDKNLILGEGDKFHTINAIKITSASVNNNNYNNGLCDLDSDGSYEHYNIINENLGTTHNGGFVTIIQYDNRGNVVAYASAQLFTKN